LKNILEYCSVVYNTTLDTLRRVSACLDSSINIWIIISRWWQAVTLLVGALCYKPEGHGFDSRLCYSIILIWSKPSSRTLALKSTQLLREMSIENLRFGQSLPKLKAKNSPPSMSRLSWNVRPSTSNDTSNDERIYVKIWWKSKSKSHYDRQSDGQSVLVSDIDVSFYSICVPLLHGIFCVLLYPSNPAMIDDNDHNVK
jgi:hypothetical protein